LTILLVDNNSFQNFTDARKDYGKPGKQKKRLRLAGWARGRLNAVDPVGPTIQTCAEPGKNTRVYQVRIDTCMLCRSIN
jgi:hypothetical protein